MPGWTWGRAWAAPRRPAPAFWSTCWPAGRWRTCSWRRPSMPARSSFDYAIVRVVPRVERGEFINAGVILFCRTRRFLAARIELDTARLRALAPDVDLAEVRQHLDVIPRVA